MRSLPDARDTQRVIRPASVHTTAVVLIADERACDTTKAHYRTADHNITHNDKR